jgi:hypothetical protein
VDLRDSPGEIEPGARIGTNGFAPNGSVAGDLLLEKTDCVKTGLKTKIRFNGQEYSSPSQLPPEVRAAYRQAAMSTAASLNKCLDKIILHGNEIPRDRHNGTRPYEDILSVVENNGHVTLPVSSEPWPTRRQVKVALAVLAAVAAAACAVFARNGS